MVVYYQSLLLLIQVYVKKKERKKKEKNCLYVPLYHSSWGMCIYDGESLYVSSLLS